MTQTYKPSIPAKDYPTLDTHPKSASEAIVDDYEQDPDFWKKMQYSGEGDEEEDFEMTQESGTYKLNMYNIEMIITQIWD